MDNMIEAGRKTILAWSTRSHDKGATEGNHRLTALTGSMLAPLLALVFLTGLFMDAWWHLHYAIGFVLIPVVVLKLASTGYRAARYYTNDPVYRAAGPPDSVPRMLAPLLAASILTTLATGVALFLQHSRRGVLSTLHTDAAIASAALIGLHLLTYIPDALATVRRELRRRPFPRAASMRITTALAVLALG